MADNVSITPGVGANIAADEIAGIKYPRSKMIVGADGVNDGDVSDANPVPMKIRGDEFFSGASKFDAKVTGDGELATTVTERERNVYAVLHNEMRIQRIEVKRHHPIIESRFRLFNICPQILLSFSCTLFLRRNSNLTPKQFTINVVIPHTNL